MRLERLGASPWFDADWYLATYPQVAGAGVSPYEHYLREGETQGFKPCPGFDPHWYLAEYPDVAQAGLSPLLHFISHGLKEGRLPCLLEAVEWDNALWQQRASEGECLSALSALLAEGSLFEAGYAGFALGRWHAWLGDWKVAADFLARRPQGFGALPGHGGPELLLVEAYGRSRQLANAWQALGELFACEPVWADVRLAACNLLGWQAELWDDAPEGLVAEWQAQRLGWINGIWVAQGLSEVGLGGPGEKLNLDNLMGGEAHRPIDRAPTGSIQSSVSSIPLVSVIVPVFRAVETLPTALRGLAAQRGVNFEVIVVDDASPDDTAAVAEAFADQDPRFRVLRQPINQGAYAARNRALAEVRGDFITVHDSDDWSHPDKLATQVAGLDAHPEWMACCSHWVRCTQDLIFSRWRMEEGWIYRNVSSLMFRREVFDALGYWDKVRVEADTEYYYRIRAAFGNNAIGEVLPGVPLAFGRAAADSLTGVGATHLVTQFKGLRADYRENSQAWHRSLANRPEALFLPAEPAQRPFEAPVGMLP